MKLWKVEFRQSADPPPNPAESTLLRAATFRMTVPDVVAVTMGSDGAHAFAVRRSGDPWAFKHCLLRVLRTRGVPLNRIQRGSEGGYKSIYDAAIFAKPKRLHSPDLLLSDFGRECKNVFPNLARHWSPRGAVSGGWRRGEDIKTPGVRR